MMSIRRSQHGFRQCISLYGYGNASVRARAIEVREQLGTVGNWLVLDLPFNVDRVYTSSRKLEINQGLNQGVGLGRI